MSAQDAELPRVVVVGSINVDLVVHAERLPAPGETVAGGRFEQTGGGKGANQAVAAARGGADVTLVSAVGDDDLGAQALAELSVDGVDVAAVRRHADAPTGIALIVVDRHGDNQIAVASGANHAIGGGEVSAALEPLAGGDDTGCVLVSFELPDAAVLAGATAARAAGWQLVVNPAPARPLPPELLALEPLLTPNRSEAAELTGLADPAAAAQALAERTQAPVVVTLGGDGALIAAGGTTVHVPTPAVEVVDTTGAGDTFNGVLATELARGRELPDAVELAVAAAAQSVTRAGAR